MAQSSATASTMQAACCEADIDALFEDEQTVPKTATEKTRVLEKIRTALAASDGDSTSAVDLLLQQYQTQSSPKNLASSDDIAVAPAQDETSRLQQEFLMAASQLSEKELREWVDEHVSGELEGIRALPADKRAQAFRSLCAEWHPDKCPGIERLATEVFQRLQVEKPRMIQQP
eukprot:gnl/TRDRNA2_/TRDRNA2_184680_c0_seq1.p1 gnl/TRDRNA2_/TRDRNA2_184680_c0~~gnl/TRDRNA2_/TRDRNA2_184680_c0_seq1.p1  ORF type:complete len:174 (+),score=38.36 gnl/TRDRNA2_/TRDRNA2_184680_c0_seq1:30-551(+)